ncbi:biotin--[acetyl-CoA-carboxylase] ligase [Aequorivita sp. H23M31]|uniref:Biotin--[acetyl-CoA-carboxylase] ligase n=1 Tax=Aequorivita ciconiae TaxID=2494375 RepID=A0A410FZA2_9FLAO|nr:biotin--[acetyl-CoA-carboxylase] ligase [Aequorivita sp. H23M31]
MSNKLIGFSLFFLHQLLSFQFWQSYYFFVSCEHHKKPKPNIVVILNIIKLNATDSTNTYLKELVNNTTVEDQTVIIAEDQEKGRGQRGSGWLSRKGQSLTFSVFKRFSDLQAENQFVISMAVSLALVEAFEKINVPDVSVKWPNDILSGKKKIAGILIENVLEGANIKHSIIGIGINVNETHFPNLPQASSIRLETGKYFQLDEMFDSVVRNVLKGLANISDHSFSDLRPLYEQNMFQRDSISAFEDGTGQRFQGKIRGISDFGELIIERNNASAEKFQLKEINFIY